MANNVTSTIHIKGTKELIDKVGEIFSHEKCEGKYSKTEWLAKTVYEEYDWKTTPMGAKWCYLEDDSRDDEHTFYFTTVSAWGFPKEYLEKLTETLVKIDDSVTVECMYEDEMPNFVGAFYGSKNGTDFREEEPDDRPDEEEFENEDGEIDDYAYDEALENYYYELRDLTEELLVEVRGDIDGELCD